MCEHGQPLKPAPPKTEQYDRAVAEWQDVYLGAITENRRAVNTQILQRSPNHPSRYVIRKAGVCRGGVEPVLDETLNRFELESVTPAFDPPRRW